MSRKISKSKSNKLSKGISTTQWGIIIAVIIIIIVGAVAVVMVTTHRPTPVVTTTTTPEKIVFYTWWATEGKIALNHFLPQFTETTGITVSPYVAPGAGGINAKYAILALIEAGKPPASFQVHFGPEMISYVEAAPNGAQSFVNMTSYAQKWGLYKNAVPEVLEAGTFNGTLLSIPVNVHRGALLYVNVQLLHEYNLPFPYNFSTLVYDTMQLVDHGVTPWMVPGGDGGWDQLNLWEDIFLYLAGPTLYNEMVYGTINFNNATVEHLINETNYWFLNFTTYDYPGWQSMTWTEGLTLLVQGKVAFQANGNWLTNYAYDYLNTTAYPPLPQYINNPNVTLVEDEFPGTEHYYAVVIDSIGVPVGPQEQEGIQLAHFWSSYAGQEAWTKWKAATYYNNATDYYNTPAQWYDYEQLVNDSSNPQDFVYQLSDGGTFDDVFEQMNSGLLTLQEVGSPGLSAWNSTLVSSMHGEEQEWLQAAKLGLGYMGWPGHPFGNYYPPWVKSTDPSKSVISENSTAVTPLVLLLFPVLLVPEVFQSKIYLVKS